MNRPPQHHIRELIERLARVSASDEWTGGLNPTQRAALSYLARANRFSRSPSHVTEFMSATRGTVSQTLKALARKGLIEEIRSTTDRRWISYDVTAQGRSVLDHTTAIEEALQTIPRSKRDSLADGLETLLRSVLRARGRRPFGQCDTCVHHRKKPKGGFCALLNEPLAPAETQQICHEHKDAA